MPSLLLRINMSIVHEMIATEELPDFADSEGGAGLSVGPTTPGLLDVCCRLVRLLDSPGDIPFMSRLIQREMIYRIPCTPCGQSLRAIANRGDVSNCTSRAIAWLKLNFDKPLRMEELAEVSRMGVSTLHHRFRALTAMSPLQYQKHLRLTAARQRMLVDGLDATSAALDGGYESVSQFSREYSRMFGQPPGKDIRTIRSTPPVQLSHEFTTTRLNEAAPSKVRNSS